MSDPCPKCGQHHPKCSAHSKQNDNRPCMRDPMRGQRVCYMHGGATKAGREKGLRNVEIQEAERRDLKLLEQFSSEIDPNISVIDQYDKALATSVAWLDICKQQIESLTTASFETKAGERKLDARIALFERALERVEKFLNNAAHLNLSERRVSVTEQQQALVAEKWHQATVEFFALAKDRLSHIPGALEALTEVEQAAPEIARRILTS